MLVHFQEKAFQQAGQPVIHQHGPAGDLKRVQLDMEHVTERDLAQEKKKDQDQRGGNGRFDRYIPQLLRSEPLLQRSNN